MISHFPPGMQRRSDVSFTSHIGRYSVHPDETSQRRN